MNVFSFWVLPISWEILCFFSFSLWWLVLYTCSFLAAIWEAGHVCPFQLTMLLEIRKVHLEPELHGARVSKKIWIRKFDFQKILKKIMVVDNTMIYHCEKFQAQIRNILIYAKREIWQDFKFFRLRTVHLFRSAYFSFLPRSEYNEFVNENFHVDHNIIYNHDFFSEFFEVKICGFNFFFGNRATCSSASVLTFPPS